MARNARGVAWSPEACMVRNAGGVACNSLGCKRQDVHPVNRTPEGGTNQCTVHVAPMSPLRGSKHRFANRPGVCTPGYFIPPLQGSIPCITIPPSRASDPCNPPLQGSGPNPSQFRYCSISFANLIQVKYQRTGRSSWRNLLKKSQIKRPNISISRRLVAK